MKWRNESHKVCKVYKVYKVAGCPPGKIYRQTKLPWTKVPRVSKNFMDFINLMNLINPFSFGHLIKIV